MRIKNESNPMTINFKRYKALYQELNMIASERGVSVEKYIIESLKKQLSEDMNSVGSIQDNIRPRRRTNYVQLLVTMLMFVSGLLFAIYFFLQ